MQMKRDENLPKMKLLSSVAVVLLVLHTWQEVEGKNKGCLHHKDSETRNSISLDGTWNFALSNTSEGVPHLDIGKIPVPSSYNDLAADSSLRDYVGVVWYDRKFHVPKSWCNQLVWIRFGSVCYGAQVWINGQMATSHVGGHVPFQAEISSLLNFGKKNHITVSVDNILSATTIPQGNLNVLNNGRIIQDLNFDYFHYAGIDGSVVVYTTPSTYIDDITVDTDIDVSSNGVINFDVSVVGTLSVTTKITVVDKNEVEVVSVSNVLTGSITVPNPNLWWPLLMNDNPGYLYTLKIELLDTTSTVIDVYHHRVGIRKIKHDSTSFTINGQPVYFRGFGRTHDSSVRGRGVDLPSILRDHHLMKWIGANGYRTSHYPYPEEVMDLADELGIMIINECPASGLNGYSDQLLISHKQSITELIRRDKNRPSVIMWSVASEAEVTDTKYEAYIKQIFDHVKTLDVKRAVTIVTSAAPEQDAGLQYVDIVLFNLYSGWSSNTGSLDAVQTDVVDITTRYRSKSNKLVMIAGYGADTESGSHTLPVSVWSEDYQSQLLSVHFQSFDTLQAQGFFFGEMIANFADYETCQSATKNGKGGGKKGIFGRDRQPKASAHLLRKRYWKLAQKLNKVKVPKDLNQYVIKIEACTSSNSNDDCDCD